MAARIERSNGPARAHEKGRPPERAMRAPAAGPMQRIPKHPRAARAVPVSRSIPAYLPPMLLSGTHSPFTTLYIVMPPLRRSPFES